MELRGQQEYDRAARYGRELALVVIEPGRPHGDAPHRAGLRAWLGKNLRSSDIAGVLSNGRIVILMPEGSAESADAFVARMKSDGYASMVGLTGVPQDGTTFGTLCRTAVAQLPVTLRHIG